MVDYNPHISGLVHTSTYPKQPRALFSLLKVWRGTRMRPEDLPFQGCHSGKGWSEWVNHNNNNNNNTNTTSSSSNSNSNSRSSNSSSNSNSTSNTMSNHQNNININDHNNININDHNNKNKHDDSNNSNDNSYNSTVKTTCHLSLVRFTFHIFPPVLCFYCCAFEAWSFLARWLHLRCFVWFSHGATPLSNRDLFLNCGCLLGLHSIAFGLVIGDQPPLGQCLQQPQNQRFATWNTPHPLADIPIHTNWSIGILMMVYYNHDMIG